MDIAKILELLVAAGFGSLITQYVLRSGERRSIRADVRKELGNVESLRWSDRSGDHATHMDELLATRRRFVAAAIIAHLPGSWPRSTTGSHLLRYGPVRRAQGAA